MSNGKRPRPESFTRAFARGIKKLDLPHVRFQDLRHTFGSLLLLEGEDLKTVSELLGHSSIKITADTYLHLLKRMKMKAANSLGKHINSV